MKRRVKYAWKRDLEHLKPDLMKWLGMTEGHQDFKRLFAGLEHVTLLHDLRDGEQTTRGELLSKLSDSVKHAKSLHKILDSIPNAFAIDELYHIAFREYASRDADFILPAFERQRNDPKMPSYLINLRGCDEDRSGVAIMLESLVRALELQKAAVQKASKSDKHEKAHRHLYYLVELAKVVSQCVEDADISKNTPGSTYHKLCSFFLHHIAKVPEVNAEGNPANLVARINKAATSFNSLPTSGGAL